MPDTRIKLFLSHAWEDKESFVEPLYQALKDEFDVWYDQARITLGDSIYEKISQGIRECDFGVVVFSPDFLRKNWTQEEFIGLKALQTKVLRLPIFFVGLPRQKTVVSWEICAA
jgi:predicted nucleotide-binding protein